MRNRFASNVPFVNWPEVTAGAACALLIEDDSVCVRNMVRVEPATQRLDSVMHEHHEKHHEEHHEEHNRIFPIPWCSSVADCGVCHRSLAIAERSNCPSERWADLIAPIIARPNMLILNVGANKGFNVNSFLRRFHR